MAHDPLSDLTPSQREAVLHENGPMLVVAGPGSGKTRVITRRIARLIETGVPPEAILAITFTNKAAKEMERRVKEICPADGAWLRTFHSTCAAILRRWPEPAGLTAGFSIYDTDEQAKVIRAALKALDIPSTQLKPSAALSAISHWKADGTTPEEALADKSFSYEHQAKAKVYEAYVRALRENNAVDFDDLLTLTKTALEKDERLRQTIQQRFDHVLIDEYQDTSPVQFQLARLFAMRTKNICATGDPDQSIYAFRKADIRNILDFEQHYPGARVVRLEHNFRSVTTVLKAADAVIARNVDRREKTLIGTREQGAKIKVISAWNEREEGLAVADEILAAYSRGTAYRDIAVFYRTNSQSRSIEAGLRSRGIPYTIVKGVEFFQRAEVKDVMSYLRVLANPMDREAVERAVTTPSRGIGKVSIDRMKALAKERGWAAREALRKAADAADIPQRAAASMRTVAEIFDTLERSATGTVAALLEDVIRLTGYEKYVREQYAEEWEERWANVRELVESAREFDEEHGQETGVVGFLTHVGLVSDSDAYDPDAPRVPLMTLHSAKGLEFKEVIATGVEEGVLPHARSAEDKAALEEERRLFFVGITRAKERLTITYALDRMVKFPGAGSGQSRFLAEIPQDLLDVDRSRGPAGVPQGLGGDWRTHDAGAQDGDPFGDGGVSDEDGIDEPSSYRGPSTRGSPMRSGGGGWSGGASSRGAGGGSGAMPPSWARSDSSPRPSRPSGPTYTGAGGFAVTPPRGSGLSRSSGGGPSGGGGSSWGARNRSGGSGGSGVDGPSSDFQPDEFPGRASAPAPGGLRVGGPVEHAAFGRGNVVRLIGSGEAARVVVRFFGVGEKTLSVAHAKLKPLG